MAERACADVAAVRVVACGASGIMHPVVGLQLSGNILTPLDDEAAGHLGRTLWDGRGLLEDLELRLGLRQAPVSSGVRVQAWSKRLAQLVAECGAAAPYFAAAYRVDPTGTAAQLLRLRDELVDAGWNGEALSGSERLVALSRLAAMPAPVLPPGGAQTVWRRWKQS